MNARILLTLAMLSGATMALGFQADPPASKLDKGGQVREDLALKEKILADQFGKFQQSLLRLKQQLERDSKQEDRDRAAILEKVLDRIKDASVPTQFEHLVDFLKGQKLGSVGEIKSAMERSNKLAEDLRDILALLREDTRTSKLREERERLEALIKELEKVIHQQKVVQGQTDAGKTDPKELKANQGRVTQATDKIAKELGGQNGQAKDPKGNNKDGGKGKDQKAEAKDAGKGGEDKKAEAKDGGNDPQAQKGDAKGDPKAGAQTAKNADDQEGKAKSGQGSDKKQADAKGSKSGDSQAQAKDNPGDKKGNEAQAKDEGKGSSKKEKTAEAKANPAGDPKDKKDGDQAQAKAGGQKGEGQKADAKGSKSGDQQSQPKSGGEKSDSKQGQAKSGSQSQGQGQAKSGGQQSPPQGNQKNDPNAQKNDPKQPEQIGKKQVEDANYKQQQAEEKIAAKDNKGASDDEGQAIKDLEAAKKKLEELLRQLREEEQERVLADLQRRCEKMLAMQQMVLIGTEGVYKSIQAHEDKKAAREDQQRSLKLSDDEKEIVIEASKAIEVLEAEGTAVAFPEVFQQVREDMKHVQRRLGVVDSGVITQSIEKDIIETLKEMIEALKKARQDMQEQKSGKSQQGQPPPNADKKLLEQIAELKMIRSMQKRVNDRTEIYGKMYQEKEGEQTGDANIRQELHNLGDRQERIFDITQRIAKGDNK